MDTGLHARAFGFNHSDEGNSILPNSISDIRNDRTIVRRRQFNGYIYLLPRAKNHSDRIELQISLIWITVCRPDLLREPFTEETGRLTSELVAMLRPNRARSGCEFMCTACIE